MHVLVVGATGALRPAVGTLAARGHTVYGLARSSTSLDAPGVVPVPVDHSDVETLRAALVMLPRFDAALVYAPAASWTTRLAFADRVLGTVVELLTSEHAAPAVVSDPDPARLDSTGVPLLLGWTGGRWHTPDEISSAAIRVLDTGQADVLGTVRPWSGRPE